MQDLLSAPPDTEFLGYERRGDEWIGYIESVNGGQSAACPEYEATIFELLLIAKHWYREFARLRKMDECLECNASIDWRTAIYAQRRLERIQVSIGSELFDEVVAEIDAELRAEPCSGQCSYCSAEADVA